MEKWIGILLIVVGVWVGAELFSKGTEHAFGGIFSSEKQDEDAVPSEPRTMRERVNDRVAPDIQGHEDKYDKMLQDSN